MSLGISSHWGVLMPSDCPYSDLTCITPQQLRTMPLIMHKRSKLQQSISKWAKTEIEKLNICATYNVMNGNPIHFVTCGLGFLLTTDNLLPDNLDSSVCFRPLNPPFEIHFFLVWKKHAVFSSAAELFLKEVRRQMENNIEHEASNTLL